MTAMYARLKIHFDRLRTSLRRSETEDGSVVPAPSPCPEPHDRADLLALRCGLSVFERDLVLLAALGELETGGADLIAEAQRDERLRRPTVALALSSLENAHWSAFASDGPLHRFHLIELEGGSFTDRAVILPTRVLQFLVGLDAPDEYLAAVSRPVRIPDDLPPTALKAAEGLIQRWSRQVDDPLPVWCLCGPDPAAKAALVAAAAGQLGRPVRLMDAGDIPTQGPERSALARLWTREAMLSGSVLVLDATEIAGPGETRTTGALSEAVEGPVVVLATDPIAVPHRPVVRVDVRRTPTAEQAEIWTAALGPLADRLDGTIDRLASHFSLGPATIRAIGAEACLKGEDQDGPELARSVWNACRGQGRPKLDELAQRIEGDAGWEDIVLPDHQRRTLQVLVDQVRRRTQVYEEWGFAERGGRGLGISALFAGASGTGKTLAAEILGGALELDVYRIDLSAVVSKWIGETEKNLRRVFDAAENGCAVLLFDEADALFGKRSDVKDSHDRYANIEVSYLLQRMEAYRGLAILTSNLKSHIDEGFLRRIRFIVDFPFPGSAERREIWRSIFPPATPTNGLDWDRLAQLNLTGGSIRNTAVNAAFLAAGAQSPVTMDHVAVAARTEYEKIGRSLTNAELRGWRKAAGHG